MESLPEYINRCVLTFLTWNQSWPVIVLGEKTRKELFAPYVDKDYKFEPPVTYCGCEVNLGDFEYGFYLK